MEIYETINIRSERMDTVQLMKQQLAQKIVEDLRAGSPRSGMESEEILKRAVSPYTSSSEHQRREAGIAVLKDLITERHAERDDGLSSEVLAVVSAVVSSELGLEELRAPAEDFRREVKQRLSAGDESASVMAHTLDHFWGSARIPRA